MRGSIKSAGRGKGGVAVWRLRFDQGQDFAGRRRQQERTFRGSKKEAEAELARLLAEVRPDVVIDPAKRTVADFLDQWLRDQVEPDRAPKTQRSYRDIAVHHVKPVLGAVRLNRLRPDQIAHFYAELRRDGRLRHPGGLSAASVLKVHQVLHAALAYAVQLDYIDRNPADRVAPRQPPRRDVPLLDDEGLHRLIGALDHVAAGEAETGQEGGRRGQRRRPPQPVYAVLAWLGLHTGIRQGEGVGLRWADIDLDRGILYVRQVGQYLPGQGVTFKEPKTLGSRRPVALDPATVQLLREHRQRQLQERLAAGPAYQDRGLAFATPGGAPIDASNLRRAWSRLLEIAGVGYLRWHDLRHAHATLMLQQGIHLKIVSARLGHSRIGITGDLYSHVAPGMDAQAAAQFGEAIRRARSGTV